jgi:hypothetical protein
MTSLANVIIISYRNAPCPARRQDCRTLQRRACGCVDKPYDAPEQMIRADTSATNCVIGAGTPGTPGADTPGAGQPDTPAITTPAGPQHPALATTCGGYLTCYLQLKVCCGSALQETLGARRKQSRTSCQGLNARAGTCSSPESQAHVALQLHSNITNLEDFFSSRQ